MMLTQDSGSLKQGVELGDVRWLNYTLNTER